MITWPAWPGVRLKSAASRGSSESQTRSAAPLKKAAADSRKMAARVSGAGPGVEESGDVTRPLSGPDPALSTLKFATIAVRRQALGRNSLPSVHFEVR